MLRQPGRDPVRHRAHDRRVQHADHQRHVPGEQCATAPGPFFGSAAVASTTLNPAANSRNFIVLGGRSGSTLGLYYYSGISFANSPTRSKRKASMLRLHSVKLALGYIPGGASATTLIASLNAPAPSKPTGDGDDCWIVRDRIALLRNLHHSMSVSRCRARHLLSRWLPHPPLAGDFWKPVRSGYFLDRFHQCRWRRRCLDLRTDERLRLLAVRSSLRTKGLPDGKFHLV